MTFIYINSVCLLYAVLGMNFVSINADCESMITGFFFSSDCIGSDDSTCPSKCTDYLTSLHESCEGEVLSTDDDEGGKNVYSVNDFLGLSIMASDACKENIKNESLSLLKDSTCSTVMETNTLASIFYCSENEAESEGKCSDFCKELIDKMYSTCAATDTVGEEGSETTAELGASVLNFFRGDTCNTYAATKAFEGESTGVSINSGCASMFTGFFFISDCMSDDSTCPSKCTDYLTSLHESCDGEVLSTDDDEGEQFYTINNFLALGLLASDACKENIQNEFLSISEDSTCSTVMETNSVASIYFCSKEVDAKSDNHDESNGECLDFCKEVIDQMYSTCEPTDKWGQEGEEITAELGALALTLFRDDTCNTYAATKSFDSKPSDSKSSSKSTTSSSTTIFKHVLLVSLITLSVTCLI